MRTSCDVRSQDEGHGDSWRRAERGTPSGGLLTLPQGVTATSDLTPQEQAPQGPGGPWQDPGPALVPREHSALHAWLPEGGNGLAADQTHGLGQTHFAFSFICLHSAELRYTA